MLKGSIELINTKKLWRLITNILEEFPFEVEKFMYLQPKLHKKRPS